MKNVFLIVAIIALTLFSSLAYCNIFTEISLQQKVQRSTIVVIGKVKSVSVSDGHCIANNRCAEVRVSQVLKGKVSGKVFVLFAGEDSEANPLCCEVGASYLFFITRVSGNYYATVNGPYGIYKVP